jgi:hypothetical protein
MDCSHLAATGLDPALLIALGAAVVIVGTLLMLATHARRGARALGVVALVLAIGLAGQLSTGPAAQAAGTSCTTDAPDTLTIVQTSTLAGLAPEVAPAAIAGRITNHSVEPTTIGTVTVTIVAVIKAAGASVGTCDAADYVLLDPLMPVGQPLAAGASIAFSGASIGFVNRETNQDACQGATVTLLYRVG